MDTKERSKMRKLQNEFLNHPRVKKYQALYGEDSQVFAGSLTGPTFKDLRDLLFPDYKHSMENILCDI